MEIFIILSVIAILLALIFHTEKPGHPDCDKCKGRGYYRERKPGAEDVYKLCNCVRDKNMYDTYYD